MKTHLNLRTRDLDASVAFYRSLLNSEPTKYHNDYALFLTESPGLELALTLDPRAKGSSDVHYGIAVESPEAVETTIARLKDAGLSIEIETRETCCYAVQDKVWATDPDGRRWETYYVVAEAEEKEGENMTCCRESGDETASWCP
jgi:catechol 2,3-dioxygenase-like lactoylglutathione lyase family enzyme